jgi:hypothetical protein
MVLSQENVYAPVLRLPQNRAPSVMLVIPFES